MDFGRKKIAQNPYFKKLSALETWNKAQNDRKPQVYIHFTYKLSAKNIYFPRYKKKTQLYYFLNFLLENQFLHQHFL